MPGAQPSVPRSRRDSIRTTLPARCYLLTWPDGRREVHKRDTASRIVLAVLATFAMVVAGVVLVVASADDAISALFFVLFLIVVGPLYGMLMAAVVSRHVLVLHQDAV